MSFNVAAESYDRFMGIWAQQLARPFADFAGVASGMRVLDVGCGPGALTTELVARTGADHVAAVDPSPTFVAAARERLPGVDVRQAPAEELPFSAETFDAAVAQLVVHFMAHPVTGLREMARVTLPGGPVAACVWDFGGQRGPLGPFWEAAHAVEHAVVDESHLAGARRGHLSELLRAAGLRAVVEEELAVSRGYDSFEAWWEPFTRGVGPGGAYVASLAPEQVEVFRERCRAELPAGSFSLDAVAWAARGVRS
ncbi:MAG TPA: class I SAM-dependent methyltransferase [Candidatus Limnocylindrales bacterium]|nr:class I SAM-dependent methyltransferase [Candidatus Limnocylindrales bacterium]